jgi:hypothetical protein
MPTTNQVFLIVYLGENVLNLIEQKVAQNVTISLSYLIFTKNNNEPPKIAQLAIWSPCLFQPKVL